MFIFDLIIFILVLGIIILIHELGHFYFAKKAGILCHEFSIGMGPALYQKRKGETVYSVRGIPIGGYVSMAGEAINDAMIKVEQVVGINLNGQGQITEIVLNQELDRAYTGVVKAYDLYGLDFNPLFITLEVDGEEKTYPVVRDAIYKLTEKRIMWITPSEKSFETKTIWQRFLVIFAGPLMNFILAFLLFFIVGFFVFKPNVSSNEVSVVVDNTPAFVAGMVAGDQITGINGDLINSWTDLSTAMSQLTSATIDLTYRHSGIRQTINDLPIFVSINHLGISNTYYDEATNQYVIYHDEARIGSVSGRAELKPALLRGDLITSIKVGDLVYPISNWDDLIQFFQQNETLTIDINYTRDGDERTRTSKLISASALEKLGAQPIAFQLGVSPTGSFDLAYSLSYSYTAFYDSFKDVTVTLGLLFSPKENLGIQDLSGPIGIFGMVSSTAQNGIISILGFTAFLSINIGFLNLLPIPALDGGRLVFLAVEAITKKPLNKKFENTVNNVMFFVLIALFIYVAFNDIFG